MNAPSKIKAPTEAQFRASVVGASEVAALFGASPWLTHFELWHRKKGSIDTPEFNAVKDGVPDDERVYFGVKLEPVVVDAACERWSYRKIETPARLDNGKGLGGHPDQIVMCPTRGRGLLEVKTADWLVAKKWGDEPPLHYLLQVMAYMGLAGCNWGDVIVLVGGNQLTRFQYDFRPIIYADIEARVVEFWRSIEAGKAPKPDYARDGDTLAEVFKDPGESLIDLRHDNRMPALLGEYLDAKEAEKSAKGRVDAAKAEILHKLGENSAALVEGFSCRAPVQGGGEDRVITSEMVGQVIKARAAHRRFYIKEKQ